jgi:hypothetical protein
MRMTDLLARIQSWYKLNCDGDWEHSYGLSINTLDNPGWWVKIDLQDTALENLSFSRNYQNENNEQDWFFIKTEEKILDINCGPANLSQIFSIFLDEIIPRYSASDFLYELYLPMLGHEPIIWTPAKGKIISESILELVEVPDIKYSEIKIGNLDNIDFTEDEMYIFTHSFEIGDLVSTDLEDMFDGAKLVARNKI